MALSIFLASGSLQQSMSTELNRMLEVMLSVVTPLQLLTGKVVGLAAWTLAGGRLPRSPSARRRSSAA